MVPPILGGSIGLVFILEKFLSQNDHGIFGLEYPWEMTAGIGFLLAGMVIFFTRKDFIVVHGEKQRVYLDNSLFCFPLKIWSYIMFVIGILAVLGGLAESMNL